MEKHCQECHACEFEPAVTTREVPHGDAPKPRTVVEEFYANLALKGVPDSFCKAFGVPGEGLLRRVGEPLGGPAPGRARPGERQGAARSRRSSSRCASCKTCHEVTRPRGWRPDWKVAPIRANNVVDAACALRPQVARAVAVRRLPCGGAVEGGDRRRHALDQRRAASATEASKHTLEKTVTSNCLHVPRLPRREAPVGPGVQAARRDARSGRDGR